MSTQTIPTGTPPPPDFPGRRGQRTPACRRLFCARGGTSRSLLVGLAALAGLAGCTVEGRSAGEADLPSIEVEPTPAATSTSTSTTAAPASTPVETFVDPAPTSEVGPSTTAFAGDTLGYLAALTAVDPGELGNPDRAVDRGLNVCQEVEAGKPRDVVFRNAGLRFDLTGQASIEGVVSISIVFLCPDAVLQ